MKRLKRSILISFIILNFVILTACPAGGEVDYDLTYVDSEGDVEMFGDDGISSVTGHEDVDILSISSSKLTMRQNIVLELMVTGQIQASDNFTYGFTILDQEEEVYVVYYNSGMCMGMAYQDYGNSEDEPDMLIATGAGTDTLKVTIPIENLGEISSYDFYGISDEMVEDEDTFNSYSDIAPDREFPWTNGDGDDDWEERILTIMEPTHGGTVFETIDIKGMTNNYDEDIESVEVQIDSRSSSGWELVRTTDDWYTWSYEWDTEEVTDGEHTIYTRAFDGFDYYFDTITVHVHQDSATAPKNTEVPDLHVGDKYEYELVYDSEYTDLDDVSVTGTMTFEVTGLDTINVNGIEHDVYVFQMNSVNEFSEDGYTSKDTSESTTWFRKSDLAIVKQESNYASTDPEGGQYSSHGITTYEPPLNQFNFPLSVCNKWESISTVNTKSTYTYDGETNTDEYSETITIKAECLRTETVSVSTGSFETFLIHNVQEYDDNWDDDDWEYEDSDDDGWSDEDEEDFGTDPNDPEDYPFADEEDGGDGDGGVEEYGDEEEMYTENMDYSYSSLDCSIMSYSPDVGFIVKMEYYDDNRELTSSYELVSYNYTKDDTINQSTPAGSKGYRITLEQLFVFIIICVIIIIIAMLAVRRRRKKTEAILIDQSASEIGTENVQYNNVSAPVEVSEVKFQLDEPKRQ